MTPPLVRSTSPLALVGGGPVAAEDIEAARGLTAGFVAADGGAAHLAGRSIQPLAVIGDMDSANADTLAAAGMPVHRIAEQDSTDLEKCLRAIEAPLLLGLGFLGGRADHNLAAMNALVRHAGAPLVLLGGEDICFRCPETLALDLAAGTRVSIFPMAPITGCLSEGLRWDIDGLAMRPDGQIGTSNIALGGRMRMGFDGPAALVILPRHLLAQVTEALLQGAP